MEVQIGFRKVQQLIKDLIKQITKSSNFILKTLSKGSAKKQQKQLKQMQNRCKLAYQKGKYQPIQIREYFKYLFFENCSMICPLNNQCQNQTIYKQKRKIIFILKLHTVLYQMLLMCKLQKDQLFFFQIFGESLTYMSKIIQYSIHLNCKLKLKLKESQILENKKNQQEISIFILQISSKMYQLFSKLSKQQIKHQIQTKINPLYINYISFFLLIQISSLSQNEEKHNLDENKLNQGESTLNIKNGNKSNIQLQKSFVSENAKSIDQENPRPNKNILSNISNFIGSKVQVSKISSKQSFFIKESNIIRFYYQQAIKSIGQFQTKKIYELLSQFLTTFLFLSKKMIHQNSNQFAILLMQTIKSLMSSINNAQDYSNLLKLFRSQLQNKIKKQQTENNLQLDQVSKIIDLLIIYYEKVLNHQYQTQEIGGDYQQNRIQKQKDENEFQNVNIQIVIIISTLIKNCKKQILSCSYLNTILTVHQIFCNQVNFNCSQNKSNLIQASFQYYKQHYKSLKQELINTYKVVFRFKNIQQLLVQSQITLKQYKIFRQSFIKILVENLSILPIQISQIISLLGNAHLQTQNKKQKKNIFVFDIFMGYIMSLYLQLIQSQKQSIAQTNKKSVEKFTKKVFKSLQKLCLTISQLKHKLWKHQTKTKQSQVLLKLIQISQNKMFRTLEFLLQSKLIDQQQTAYNIICIVSKLLDIHLSSEESDSNQNSTSRVILINNQGKWFDQISLTHLLRIAQKIHHLHKSNNYSFELNSKIQTQIIQKLRQVNILPLKTKKSPTLLKKIFKVNTECLLQLAIQNISNIKQKQNQEAFGSNLLFALQILAKSFQNSHLIQLEQSCFTFMEWLFQQKQYLTKIFLILETYNCVHLNGCSQKQNKFLNQIISSSQKISHLLVKEIYYNILESLIQNNTILILVKFQFLHRYIFHWKNISSVYWLNKMVQDLKMAQIQNKQLRGRLINIICKIILKLIIEFRKQNSQVSDNQQKQALQKQIGLCNTKNILKLIFANINTFDFIQNLQLLQLNQLYQTAEQYQQINQILILKLILEKNDQNNQLEEGQRKQLRILTQKLTKLFTIAPQKQQSVNLCKKLKKIQEAKILGKILQFQKQYKNQKQSFGNLARIIQSLNLLLVKKFDKLKQKSSCTDFYGQLQTPCFKISARKQCSLLVKEHQNNLFQSDFIHVVFEQKDNLDSQNSEKTKKLIISQLQIQICSNQKISQQENQILGQCQEPQDTQNSQKKNLQLIKTNINLICQIISSLGSESKSQNLQKIKNTIFPTTQIIYSIIINKHLYRQPSIFELFLILWKQVEKIKTQKNKLKYTKFLQIIKGYLEIKLQGYSSGQITSIKDIIIIIYEVINGQFKNKQTPSKIQIEIFTEINKLCCLVVSLDKHQHPIAQEQVNKKIQDMIDTANQFMMIYILKQTEKNETKNLQQFSQVNLQDFLIFSDSKILRLCINFINFAKCKNNKDQNIVLNICKNKQIRVKKKLLKQVLYSIHPRELIQKKQYNKILILIQSQCSKQVQSGLMSHQFQKMFQSIEKNQNCRNQFFLQVFDHVLGSINSSDPCHDSQNLNIYQQILQSLYLIFKKEDQSLIEKIMLKIMGHLSLTIRLISKKHQTVDFMQKIKIREIVILKLTELVKIYLYKRYNFMLQCIQLKIQLSEQIKKSVSFIFSQIQQIIKQSNTQDKIRVNGQNNYIKKWFFFQFYNIIVDYIGFLGASTDLVLKKILKNLNEILLNKSCDIAEEHVISSQRKEVKHNRIFTYGSMNQE